MHLANSLHSLNQVFAKLYANHFVMQMRRFWLPNHRERTTEYGPVQCSVLDFSMGETRVVVLQEYNNQTGHTDGSALSRLLKQNPLFLSFMRKPSKLSIFFIKTWRKNDSSLCELLHYERPRSWVLKDYKVVPTLMLSYEGPQTWQSSRKLELSLDLFLCELHYVGLNHTCMPSDSRKILEKLTGKDGTVHRAPTREDELGSRDQSCNTKTTVPEL